MTGTLNRVIGVVWSRQRYPTYVRMICARSYPKHHGINDMYIVDVSKYSSTIDGSSAVLFQITELKLNKDLA